MAKSKKQKLNTLIKENTLSQLYTEIRDRVINLNIRLDNLKVNKSLNESIKKLSKKINEVVFGTPFNGNDIKKEVSKEELLRMIRFAIAAEYEAIQLYQQIANSTKDKDTKKIMTDVAKEELVHVGEFQQLLNSLSPDDKKLSKEGQEEAIELMESSNDVTIYRGDSTKVSLKDYDVERAIKGGKELGSAFSEGPGIYFTKDINNAKQYGKNVTSGTLSKDANIISKQSKKFSKAQIEKILNGVPKETLKIALSNWDENPVIAKKKLITTLYNGDTAQDQLINIWADVFYHQSANEFMKLMSDNGIHGFKVDKDNSTHYVIFDRNKVINLKSICYESKINERKDNTFITLYRGLTTKLDKDFNLSDTLAPIGYSYWTDNPEVAKQQYAGGDGFVYQIELPKKLMGKEIMDEDGERYLFYDNDKIVGEGDVIGKEYLVYMYHDKYSPNMITEYIPEINYGNVTKESLKEIKGIKNLLENYGDTVIPKAGMKAHIGDIVGVFWYNSLNNNLDYKTGSTNHSDFQKAKEYSKTKGMIRGRVAKDDDKVYMLLYPGDFDDRTLSGDVVNNIYDLLSNKVKDVISYIVDESGKDLVEKNIYLTKENNLDILKANVTEITNALKYTLLVWWYNPSTGVFVKRNDPNHRHYDDINSGLMNEEIWLNHIYGNVFEYGSKVYVRILNPQLEICNLSKKQKIDLLNNIKNNLPKDKTVFTIIDPQGNDIGYLFDVINEEKDFDDIDIKLLNKFGLNEYSKKDIIGKDTWTSEIKELKKSAFSLYNSFLYPTFLFYYTLDDGNVYGSWDKNHFNSNEFLNGKHIDVKNTIKGGLVKYYNINFLIIYSYLGDKEIPRIPEDTLRNIQRRVTRASGEQVDVIFDNNNQILLEQKLEAHNAFINGDFTKYVSFINPSLYEGVLDWISPEVDKNTLFKAYTLDLSDYYRLGVSMGRVNEKIKKIGNKYRVVSKTGKNLGEYNTKKEAEKRLKQVEMFKYMKKSKIKEETSLLNEDDMMQGGATQPSGARGLVSELMVSNPEEPKEKKPEEKQEKEEEKKQPKSQEEEIAKDAGKEEEQEKKEDVAESEKTSLGNDGGEKYFYFLKKLSEDGDIVELQVLDANDEVVFSSEDDKKDVADIRGFLQEAFKKLEIANINYEIVEEYFFNDSEKDESSFTDKSLEEVPEEQEVTDEALLIKYGFASDETSKLLEKFGLTLNEDDPKFLPPQQVAGEVPTQEMPATEQGDIVSDKPAGAMVADYSTPEAARAQIQLDYPEEPLTTTAMVFADSIVNDPKIYSEIRKLHWDGIYTDADGLVAQAKIVGDYREFNLDIIKLLTDRLGNGCKYCLGRDKGPTVKVTVRDPEFSISLSGLKELVAATSIEKTGAPGEVVLKW